MGVTSEQNLACIFQLKLYLPLVLWKVVLNQFKKKCSCMILLFSWHFNAICCTKDDTANGIQKINYSGENNLADEFILFASQNVHNHRVISSDGLAICARWLFKVNLCLPSL